MLEYKVTFGEIPLLLDSARVVRMPMEQPANEDTPNLPPLKHQPLVDLIDEINRLIPLHFTKDICYPSSYIGRNLGAVAYPSGMSNEQLGKIHIGDWYYPSNACRWSIFRGLATSSQAKAMLEKTEGTKAKPFVMECNPVAPYSTGDETYYTLTSNMYMLPPRPLAEHGDGFDGLYLITLVDERYYWQNSPVGLHVTGESTWRQLLTLIGQSLNVEINLASPIEPEYGQPEVDSQLWSTMENAPVLLDAVAANIGRVLVRRLNGTFTLLTPIESRDVALLNRGDATKVTRTAGGDIFQSGKSNLKIGELTKAKNSVVASGVIVSFPKYVVGDDPVPHFLNKRYQKQRPSAWYEEGFGSLYDITVPITSGGPIVSGLQGMGLFYLHTTSKALLSGEAAQTPLNLSGMNALAMRLAGDYYNRQVAIALDETYPGTYTWIPEGIHDIIWTISVRRRQGLTRVLHREWTEDIQEFQHATSPLSGYSSVPKGVGGHSVAQSWKDAFSGSISTTLNQTMLSGASTASFAGNSYFPTQNRWRGQIDGEVILFEGTSGQTTVNVAYRAIDGTLASLHNNGSQVTYILPNETYGVNLVKFEKGQFIYPAQWTSGGIQAVHVVPQTQSVKVIDDSGKDIGGTLHYSGSVQLYDSSNPSVVPPFYKQEYIWIVDRNDNDVMSGRIYNGQFVGFSQGTAVAPIYVVDSPGDMTSLTVREDDLDPTYTGIDIIEVHAPSFILTQPGTGIARIEAHWGADIQSVGSFNYEGTDELFARDDHVHAATIPPPPYPPLCNQIAFEGFFLKVYNCITQQWVYFCPCFPDGSGSGDPECGCDICPDGVPTEWVFTIANAIGDFSGATGDWTLEYVSDCLWEGMLGGVECELEYQVSTARWRLLFAVGGSSQTFYNTNPFLCCGTNSFLTRSITGSGAVADLIYISPMTTCGDPCEEGPPTCDCSFCPSGAPPQWSFIADASSNPAYWADATGPWTLDYQGECVWSATKGDVTCTLSPINDNEWKLYFTQNVFNLFYDFRNYVTTPTGHKGDPFVCCDDNVFLAFNFSSPASTYGRIGGPIVINPTGACEPCGPVVISDCCEETGVPETLHFTLTNATGSCACLNGTGGSLVYDGSDSWRGSFSACVAGDTTFRLFCSTDAWTLTVNEGGPGSCQMVGGTNSSYDCEPFHLEFNNQSVSVCCLGTIDIIITT